MRTIHRTNRSEKCESLFCRTSALLSMCLLLLAPALPASAHDFAQKSGVNTLYFRITGPKSHTVEVTYPGSIANGEAARPTGLVEIPSTVSHDGVSYRVTGISAKAFSESSALTGVIIPTGVSSVGDFAFEGCTSLESVVFPANAVRFGEGVFFRCVSLSSVTLGSDWREVDLRIFRWSDSLRTVHLPVRLERVVNLKSLRSLESVTADANNPRFRCADGLLYSKDGTVLYACPRARKGEVRIEEGTKSILRGALVDCLHLTAVDFPSSLETLHCGELVRLYSLESVTFRSVTPPTNARKDGRDWLLLRLGTPVTKIVVPGASKKSYFSQLAMAAGTYEPVGGEPAVEVQLYELPVQENVTVWKGQPSAEKRARKQ